MRLVFSNILNKNKASCKHEACFKKQIYKPNSVLNWALIIYLRYLLPNNFSCLPSNNRACSPQTLVYMTLHHIEFTWFHYSITCTYFLLHFSSSYDGWLLATIFALWCSDFPTLNKFRIDKAICLASKVHKLLITPIKFWASEMTI